MKCRAGEIALVDLISAVVSQVGHQSSQKMKFIASLSGWKSRATMEHVVMIINSHHYQPLLTAKVFPEPVRDDIVMGINNDRSDSPDENFMRENVARGVGHGFAPIDRLILRSIALNL
jgi:hypothetical protein